MTINSINDYSNYAASFDIKQSPPITEKAVANDESADTAKRAVGTANVTDAERAVREAEAEKVSEVPDTNSIFEQLDSVNECLPMRSTSLIFEFDDANDPPVIKVVDKDSGDIIREIPPKELREIAQALNDIADNLNRGVSTKSGNQPSGILINSQS